MNRNELECFDIHSKFQRKYFIKDRVNHAIWEFPIELPEPPEPHLIANFGLPKEKRKFPYYTEEYVNNYSLIYDDIVDNNEISKDRELDYMKFITEEWRRRREGFWFYNGDNLEYITGHNYMFLQYWKIPVTQNRRKKALKPKFKDVHRDLFHCIEQAKNDRKCAGIIYTSLRRIGKTVVAIADGYFDTTGNTDSVFAIQSKSEGDAKNVFSKVVYSWQKLPSFFRPRDTGDTRVVKKMSFTSANIRNTKKQSKEISDALDSEIIYVNAKEEALDGLYCSYIINDEAGKCKGVDVNERWNINKECLVDGDDYIGFGFIMTTVEDMEKYDSDKYLTLWERSDPKKRMRNGQTDSGLYQLFFPAYYGFEGKERDDDGQEVASFVDEWGYTDIPKSLAYFKQMYEDKAGDLSYRRKYPIDISDSFSITTNQNTFDQKKIRQQSQHNKTIDIVVRGTFYWEGGIKDTHVVFKPEEEGKWLVAWMPPEDDRNKYTTERGQRSPTRDFCKTGCDPFSHRATYQKGSEGAATTILNAHYLYPRMKKAIVCHYLARPQHPHEFAEDMILQSVFYSSHILIESNKFGVIDYFHKRGYDGYCLGNPLLPAAQYFKDLTAGRRGIATTFGDIREALIGMTQAYILDYVGQINEEEYGFCPFNEILKDWRHFEPDNWTPYDSFVSTALSIAALRRPKFEPMTEFSGQANWYKAWN